MLSGKTVLVAGGAHGIGRATAVELGRSGANVVISDLGTSVTGEGEGLEAAEETATAVRDAGGEALVHGGDVASLDDTAELVDVALAEYGRIDGAVNFAGIVRDSISWKMTEEEFDRVVRVHLRGHFSLLRNVAEHWREAARDEGGEFDSQRSFLGVTSRSALGSVGQLNYASAKAGVMGMMRTAARELDWLNVRVNALMPTAHTRMTEAIPEEKRRERPGPENVAPVVAYLMSDEAEGINGWTIRSVGDQVGLVSDPAIERVAFREGGWTVEALAESFRDTVGEGQRLNLAGED